MNYYILPKNEYIYNSIVSQPTLDNSKAKSIYIYLDSPCGRPALPPIARVRLNRGNRLFLVCKENYSTSKLGLMHCVGNKWRILKSISCLGMWRRTQIWNMCTLNSGVSF